ncbi:MAG: hypothetical protein H6923_03415 [Alphaproteobacteria bacterium]|nr:hypothetical protein [Alphaproteobacteria bacterium]
MVKMVKARLARLKPLLLAPALAGCTTGASLMALHGDPDMSFSGFHVCHGYGCSFESKAALSAEEVSGIGAIFRPPPASAEEERARIGAAVARVETLVGTQIGTSADEAGAGPFGGIKQQDCIDEAVNTTHYLTLMERAGWLAFHRVGEPAHRGIDIGRWPHNTATVIETASGRRYVIDSWFHANGEAPEIVPVELWATGWGPEKR